MLQFDNTGTGDAAAGDLSHRYLWGPAVDQVLADEQVSSLSTPGVRYWPLSDHLGSVRDVIDDGGTVQLHRIYDAFGNLIESDPANIAHLFAFTGRPLDEDSGLQNNLNRWYDLSTGRWMSEDPILFRAGDANLYRYVFNSPISLSDPSGLFRFDVGAKIPKPKPEQGHDQFGSVPPTIQAKAYRKAWLTALSGVGIIPMPQVPKLAMAGLRHYLNASGRPRSISITSLLLNPSAELDVVDEVGEAFVLAALIGKNLPPGSKVAFPMASDWKAAREISKSESLDWFGVFRGYKLASEVIVAIARKGACIATTMKMTYHVHKHYNFDKDEDFPFPLGIQVDGAPLHELHSMGLAQNYEIVGAATAKFSWFLKNAEEMTEEAVQKVLKAAANPFNWKDVSKVKRLTWA